MASRVHVPKFFIVNGSRIAGDDFVCPLWRASLADAGVPVVAFCHERYAEPAPRIEIPAIVDSCKQPGSQFLKRPVPARENETPSPLLFRGFDLLAVR